MTLDLEPIKRRLAAATPGPWRVKEDDAKTLHRGTVQVEEHGRLIETIAECYCGGYDGHGRQNAELVAHAPEDLEALIAEVERHRQEKDVEFMAASVYFDKYMECQADCTSIRHEVLKLLLSDVFKNSMAREFGDILRWGLSAGLLDGGWLTYPRFEEVWQKFNEARR
jgi:hypothetical protein